MGNRALSLQDLGCPGITWFHRFRRFWLVKLCWFHNYAFGGSFGRKLRLVLYLFPVVSIAIGSSAHAQKIGNVSDGYQLALQVCSECHSIEIGNYFSLNKNAPPFEAIAKTPGMNEMALNVWFKTPHLTMPNFKFSERETANLIAYILSLKTTE